MSSGRSSAGLLPLVVLLLLVAYSTALGFRKSFLSCVELKCLSSGRRFRDLLFQSFLGMFMLAVPFFGRTTSSVTSASGLMKSIRNVSFSFLWRTGALTGLELSDFCF